MSDNSITTQKPDTIETLSYLTGVGYSCLLQLLFILTPTQRQGIVIAASVNPNHKGAFPENDGLHTAITVIKDPIIPSIIACSTGLVGANFATIYPAKIV